MSSTDMSNTPSNASTDPAAATDADLMGKGKNDPAWRYGKVLAESCTNKTIQCLVCSRTFSGGGIHRLKEHLAGITGNVAACKKVTPEVRFDMQQLIAQKKRKRDLAAEIRHGSSSGGEDLQELDGMAAQTPTPNSNRKQSAFAEPKIAPLFQPRTTAGCQPTLKSVLQSKEAVEKCHLAISRWMAAAAIPFNAVNSPYFQEMIDAIASMGAGYKGPSFHELRGRLLVKGVHEVKRYVDSFRSIWKETGCTIMADGWTDQNRRTLINFLVYCPKGVVFLKSVDASDVSKTANVLYQYLREIVLFVGAENVVQVITDNAANYAAAGRLLEEEFKTLFWSPCAAHCINLMFGDIGNLEEVSEIVKQASQITKYIYNHCYALHLMRKFTNGRDILRPAPTRFATNFIALESILSQKDALRAMATSREWTSCAYAKESAGRKFVDLVLDSSFWKECALIVQVTEPLVRVLRLVDSDEKPAMGFLYEAIYRTRSEMVKRFSRRKRRIDSYLKIIDKRWDKQLHKYLHAAGYWLNPRFQYNENETERAKNLCTMPALVDVIERYTYGNDSLGDTIRSEMLVFREAKGDFARKSAKADRARMAPDQWWLMHGNSTPNLQKLAIRILSQTCSSSGCERNWSVFEHIHSKKRNRLEHQRLNDLVYFRYNLKLQHSNFRRDRSYDPLDFEKLEAVASWVLEDEPSTLSNEELEAFRRDLERCTIQEPQNDDDVLNLDELDVGEDEDGDGNATENVMPRETYPGDDQLSTGGNIFWDWNH